jgi:hypothetical protein
MESISQFRQSPPAGNSSPIAIYRSPFARPRPVIDVIRRRASLISSSWLHGIARYFGNTPARLAAAILLCSTSTGTSACSLLARRFPNSGSRSPGPTSTTARSCLSPLPCRLRPSRNPSRAEPRQAPTESSARRLLLTLCSRSDYSYSLLTPVN